MHLIRRLTRPADERRRGRRGHHPVDRRIGEELSIILDRADELAASPVDAIQNAR